MVLTTGLWGWWLGLIPYNIRFYFPTEASDRSMSQDDQPLDVLAALIERAKAAGADAADAVLVGGTSLSLSRRLGKPESLTRSEGADLGLRVLIGRRQAIVSSSDLSSSAMDELAARAVAMAGAVPEDPFCGLAEADLLATEDSGLDLCDTAEPPPETLTEWTARAEDAALGVAGVTNSEGAEAGWQRFSVALAASNGFARAYTTTRYSLSVAVLAGEGTAMERDYDYASTVHAEDLRSPEKIGRVAGEKAVARLNPRKVATAQVPVIYDPRVAGGIVRHLAGAINGAAVARGTTFLKDKLGEKIFSPSVTIVDDALRRRGLRSKPFDGEGVATRRHAVVENGVLKTWILDLRSARQLKMETTGHASRGTSSPPSPGATNLYLEPGTVSSNALMADIETGFYITELIGFGVNGVTGDYSRGAGGFWIEKGERAYPVSEVTVAGNLADMFLGLTAADDLEFRYGTDSPTLRIDGMTVAGQ